MEKNNTRKLILLIVGLAVIVAAFAVVYNVFVPKGQSGAKTVSVTVVYGAEADNTEVLTLKTDAAYLGDALKERNLIEGETSEYGMFISAVNGVKADESALQWWCITKGGEEVFTGVDVTPIADGDAFELTLKTGY